MNKIIKLIYIKFKEINQHHLSAFAAQATLFIILSAFPFLILLLSSFNFLPLSAHDLIENLDLFIPENIIPTVKSIILEISKSTTSVYFISASILTIIWSSVRGFVAIRHALNSVNRTKETRNFITVRLISSLYTFGLIIFLILLLMFLVFSRQLSQVTTFPLLKIIFQSLLYSRVIISFIVLFLFFIILYRAVPNCSFPLRYQIPGALLSAGGWLLFSFFFFLYTTYLSNLSRIYGSLSVIIVFILWLYFCMYILFIGAAFNYNLFIHKYANKSSNLKC